MNNVNNIMNNINNINRRKFLEFIGCCTCGLIIPSCTTVPITERKQLSIFPESYINRQAFQLFENVKKKIKLSDDKKTLSKKKNKHRNTRKHNAATNTQKPDEQRSTQTNKQTNKQTSKQVTASTKPKRAKINRKAEKQKGISKTYLRHVFHIMFPLFLSLSDFFLSFSSFYLCSFLFYYML